MTDEHAPGLTARPSATGKYQILARVAASRKGLVTLVDLNARLDPGGHYQAVVDGVTVRNSDGIHLTKAAGVWLQPLIMPTIARLGLAARSA